MSILIVLLTAVLVLISAFLVFIVLLQKPRAESGLGTAMGGGMAEATFGSETGNVLTRATIYAAIAFFVVAFALYLMQLNVAKHPNAGGSNDKLPTNLSAPSTPAPAPTAAPTAQPEAPKP